MMVISPLSPDRKGFRDEDRLKQFIDAVTEDLSYLESRFYLLGMSRGENGQKDPVISVAESIRMTEPLKASGNPPLLTIHPESGHDVWTKTFESDETIQWLLGQRRASP